MPQDGSVTGMMSSVELQSPLHTGSWDRGDPRAARRAIRSGSYAGYTAGIAGGYVQANVCILPRAYAEDFLLYCQRNPKPCPLLARSDPGDPRLPTLAENLDIRTDIARYHVFRDGELAQELADISSIWSEDSSPLRSVAPSPSRKRCSRRVCDCAFSNAAMWPGCM